MSSTVVLNLRNDEGRTEVTTRMITKSASCSRAEKEMIFVAAHQIAVSSLLMSSYVAKDLGKEAELSSVLM